MRTTYETFEMIIKDIQNFDDKQCDTMTAVLLKECAQKNDSETVRKAIRLLEQHRPTLAEYVKQMIKEENESFDHIEHSYNDSINVNESISNKNNTQNVTSKREPQKEKITNYFFQSLTNYAKFSGRSGRKEFLVFVLVVNIFYSIAAFLDILAGTSFSYETPNHGSRSLVIGYIYVVSVLFFIIPGIAVTVRRLHDVGKSGWMLLLLLLPIVGPVYIIVLLLTGSKYGENKYGENPKSNSACLNKIDNLTSDFILFLTICIWLFNGIKWPIVNILVKNYTFDPSNFGLLSTTDSALFASLPFLFILIIKEKSKRRIAIALSIIMILYNIYSSTQFYLQYLYFLER